MSTSFMVGEWRIEPSKNRIVRGSEFRTVQAHHMRVLVYLSAHPGKQIPNSTLLQVAYRNKRAGEDSLSVVVSHLRDALDDVGDRPKYIKQVPARGYTLLAKVKKDRSEATQQSTNRSRLPWKLLSVAILIAALAFWKYPKDHEPAQTTTTIATISILPLQNRTGTAAAARLTDVVEMSLMQVLVRLPHVEVVSLPTGPDPLKVLADLGVDAFVDGAVRLDGNRLVLSAQISSVKPKQMLWARRFEGELEEILQMQRSLSTEMTAFLSHTAVGVRLSSSGGQISSEAYLAFADGYSLLMAQKFTEATVLFEQARTLSPKFADAYLGLALAKTKLAQADPLLLRKELAHLTNLLERAIELKPDLAAAYTALGALQYLHGWSFEQAEKNMHLALKYNPNDSETHHQYALFCLAFGRFEEARDHLERSRKLAPLTYSTSSAAWVYTILGDYEAAQRELKLLAEKEPDSHRFHSACLKLYEKLGEQELAYYHYQALFRGQGYTPDELKQAHEIFNTRHLPGLNRWLAFEKFEQDDVGQYKEPLSIGRFLAAANEKDLAFDWLEKALAVKQTQLLWLNVDPKYDNLRSDPRFTKLTQAIGLNYRAGGPDR